MSIFGAAYSEGTLVRLARVVEQTTRAREPPAYRSNADLGAPTACGQNCGAAEG